MWCRSFPAPRSCRARAQSNGDEEIEGRSREPPIGDHGPSPGWTGDPCTWSLHPGKGLCTRLGGQAAVLLESVPLPHLPSVTDDWVPETMIERRNRTGSSCSERDVDYFDLTSEPSSRARFGSLQEEASKANKALHAFCVEHPDQADIFEG